MQAFIAQRLAEMKNQDERALMRELLADIFMPLHLETEAKYAALEQRVRNELPLVYDVYTIYSTVLPRENIDSKHDYLNAIIQDETEEPKWTARNLLKAIKGGDEPIIETVFAEADDLLCRKIAGEKRILSGTLIAKTGQYQFKYRLDPSTRYTDRLKTMYDTFIKNNVPWTTVNAAYLNKFFDVRLISVDGLPENALIQSFDPAFFTYDEFIRRGMIPVWNVDTYQVKGEDFSKRAEDGNSYEYAFELQKLGIDNGYLVNFDNELVTGARLDENALVVISPLEQGLVWSLYRIRRRPDPDVSEYPFPVLSNKRKDTFSARLTLMYGAHITTPAAMRTLLLSLEPSEFLQLTDFRFSGGEPAGDSYDMNPFIRDDVRKANFQKTLEIVFKAKKYDLFINRDLLSFVVTEFQAAYPEYRCVGVLD